MEAGRLALEYDLHVCDTSGTGTHGTAARQPPGSTAGRAASSRQPPGLVFQMAGRAQRSFVLEAERCDRVQPRMGPIPKEAPAR